MFKNYWLDIFLGLPYFGFSMIELNYFENWISFDGLHYTLQCQVLNSLLWSFNSLSVSVFDYNWNSMLNFPALWMIGFIVCFLRLFLLSILYWSWDLDFSFFAILYCFIRFLQNILGFCLFNRWFTCYFFADLTCFRLTKDFQARTSRKFHFKLAHWWKIFQLFLVQNQYFLNFKTMNSELKIAHLA